jgi:hypothetical protein
VRLFHMLDAWCLKVKPRQGGWSAIESLLTSTYRRRYPECVERYFRPPYAFVFRRVDTGETISLAFHFPYRIANAPSQRTHKERTSQQK